MRARPFVLCAALGAVAALALPAAPALAATTANQPASAAGYTAVLDPAARRTALGSITVPTVSCSPKITSPLFVSIGLFGTASGTPDEFDYVTGELVVSCTGRTAYYEAAAVTNPERTTGAVAPGDRLTVNLQATATRTTVTLTDVTSGLVLRSTGNGVDVSTAQATVQGGFEQQTYPRPTAVRFGGLKVDGAAFGSYAPSAYDHVDGDTVLLEASPLSANGLAFSVRYRAQP